MQALLEWVRSRYFGKYRGKVVDNADSTNSGKLKVSLDVIDSMEVWAMPCVPYAGKGVGFYSLPEPGTGVWVEFEGGDLSFPVWTGFFWGDGELPDPGGAAVKIWKTENLTLRFDDDADEMLLKTGSDSSITLNDKITSSSSDATHTVGSDGVVSEMGLGKVEVTDSGVSVNGGALEVT
jgi:uncharacterized protein involved in type VI secretion and phage assembly